MVISPYSNSFNHSFISRNSILVKNLIIMHDIEAPSPPPADQRHPDNKPNNGGATLANQGGNLSLKESGGIYEKPLSYFGCGIGWFSFLLGFAFPPLWYYATVLYFGNYYRKDPRERPGLAASAIAVSTELRPKILCCLSADIAYCCRL
ncbi:hypothetical protein TIFTF001_001016 [Ficus carica]|uniref:Uncharacterized protein n=1 Tax=Ficus carica TaxID=3494 RepID=A0AA87YY09_FICCA|nr:hypothetical protein TIFTF001_001016 [Ficus carica]